MNISVVIPTYNRFEVLKRALKSVYAQSLLPFEVIVVDDGSSDDTSKIIDFFPNIKYLYQKNSGVSSARNFGIRHSTSEWVAFLDSDDTWHQDKLEKQALFHLQNPKVLISYTDEKWMRNNKEVKVPKKYKKVGGEIFKDSLSHCIIAPSATLMHKKLFSKVGFFDEDLEVCEDYDLWLRIAYGHHIGLINEKLITKYGGGVDQLSMKYWGMDRFRVRALENLLATLSKDDKIKDMVIKTLLQKYDLLLKGAKKHGRVDAIREYESRLESLKV